MYLQDITSRYKNARRMQDQIAAILGNEKMMLCGKEIAVQYCKACGFVHITASRTCKHRLCPTCQLRKSRRLAYNARAVIARLATKKDIGPYRLALITLTQRNVQPGSLSEEIEHLQEALGKLRHVRKARRDILGSVRTVEVTYNPIEDTWHPHVHMIGIIKADSALLNWQWWRDTWAELRQLDYAPQVDAQIVIRDEAVYEVSKYISKLVPLLQSCPQELQQARLQELNDATAGRNMLVYTGLWRELRKEIKADDDSDKNMPMHDNGCLGQVEDALMRWTGSEYQTFYDSGA